MRSTASTVDAYLAELPPERQAPMRALRQSIHRGLPAGFEETMSCGMIGWVVPHRLYPAGYHCNPRLPLPFLSLAAQKQACTIHHMGLYAESELLAWFTAEHAKASAHKLDMGKCCIRYRKPEHIPLALIEQLASRMTPAQWIERYEQAVKGSRRRSPALSTKAA